jgi:hypothetical protein
MSRIGLGRHGQIEERAGDPLDGLVNLFDIGMVLAVAFLIAGLALTAELGDERAQRHAVAPDARVSILPPPAEARQVRGRGTPVGTVYRLADGRLVVVSPRR